MQEQIGTAGVGAGAILGILQKQTGPAAQESRATLIYCALVRFSGVVFKFDSGTPLFL